MLNELTAGVIATVPGVVATVELFMRLPISAEIGKLHATTGKSIKVISSSRISDHWKEKATQRYSRTILTSSCLLFFYLIVLLMAFCAVYVLAGLFLFAGIEQGLAQLLQVKIQLVAVVVGVLYTFMRKRLSHG